MSVPGGQPPDENQRRLAKIRQHRLDDSDDDPSWMRGIFHGDDDEHAAEAEHFRSRPSRALHRMGQFSAHAGAGLVAAAFVLGWTAYGFVIGFPDWWETVLYSTSASITLVMVFVLQHMQSRLESATQRKLDELLRSTPRADNQLIGVEEASDAELQMLTEINRADRDRARQPGEPDPS